MLKRAVRTMWSVMHVTNCHHIKIHNSWRLNERHYGKLGFLLPNVSSRRLHHRYHREQPTDIRPHARSLGRPSVLGALTGLSKEEAKVRFGEEMLHLYRRGFHVQPMLMKENHPFYGHVYDGRYDDEAVLPYGESLGMCLGRVKPYWKGKILPSVRKGKRVLVAAHNNVLRCLCSHLDGINEKNLEKLEIPTGAPLLYHLDADLKPINQPDERGFRGQFLEISDAEVEHVKDVDCAYFEEGIEMSFISDTQLRSERRRLKDAAKGTSLDFDL
mmetsp:Transcript_17777/g.46524  ORF Transcript_17777/g.46524 Transcript_17777/m.46524 type:complete len:272 (+) Transcript_17777:470-1285(+)